MICCFCCGVCLSLLMFWWSMMDTLFAMSVAALLVIIGAQFWYIYHYCLTHDTTT